ncbi:hypothetical protein BgiMline_007006, partial [Biomphalaria glabrata]
NTPLFEQNSPVRPVEKSCRGQRDSLLRGGEQDTPGQVGLQRRLRFCRVGGDHH